jgi:glycosyltransferase involved in cell wall biosynthesis
MKRKKFLFLCSIYPPEMEVEYFSGTATGFQAAAVAFQWNILYGLEKSMRDNIQLLSGVFIPQFSRSYRKIYFKGKHWSHNNHSMDYCISFLNIFPIKNIFREIYVKKMLKRWIRNNQDYNLYVIAYSPHVPFIKALKTAKKYGVITCAIIPDLPEFAGESRMNEFFYRLFKGFDVKEFYKAARNIDYFVFLTDKMKDRFSHDFKYTVVEAICDPNLANYEPSKETKEKVILYSGSIMREYGILQLVESFRFIDSRNIKLLICGDGNAKEDIVKASSNDARIQYLGCLSREKVLKLQRMATVLVNPRGRGCAFTEYSFPSKTLEYMLAAKPVICCKLKGIPDDYDNYLIYVNDNTPYSIANRIIEVCSMSVKKRCELGCRARDFVVSEKNYLVQTQKIIELISSSK